MKKYNERGAIVVEATLCLTTFMFAILIILSLVNICYIQSRMSVALNSAAKEISQYSYLYYKLGIDKVDKDLSEGTEDSKQTAINTIDGVGVLMESLSDGKESFEEGDFDKLFKDANTGAKTVQSLITEYSEKLRDDPKAFILGMGKMAASELKEEGKALLGQVLAKTFMSKNLKAHKDDDPDRFLKAHRVVDGLDGLDFEYSALMAYGTSNQIQLCVTYDVSVIKLMGFDYKFTFRQLSRTCAWGNGISESLPNTSTDMGGGSLWDLGDTERGKAIVLEEKKNYEYTADRKFDAYNNADGANEFIGIMSINPALPGYAEANDIKNVISNNYRNLASGTGGLSEDIKATNKNGETVTLKSPVDTRTYKIVVVVPDNADTTLVDEAIALFKESWPDDNVIVEVKSGYGNPTEKKEQQQN